MAQNAVGNFVNDTTPRWLSATDYPLAPPANLTVSTLTVGYTGGIVMTNNFAQFPNTEYAELSFVQAYSGKFTTMYPNLSKNVPGQLDQEVLTMSQNDSGIISYDDFALSGIQIFGNQLLNANANTGCAGLITKGSLPFSVKVDTGQFQTAVISTGVINASIGNFSTINVSSINGGSGGGGGSVTDPFLISSIQASSINSGTATIPNLSSTTGYISSLKANEITTSTLNVSSFQLGNVLQVSSLNASTLSAVSANISNISSGTITAGIGTFSTLITAGGGGVTTSTINSSTINTGLLSTTTGVIKEIFTSSMTFNATLSPNLDLGLGGVIGGLVGGFGANALGVGLGAAALGTGIAGLVMPRTSGGINPTIFQTVNGTSQLQFSTLGVSTTGTIFTSFVSTDSANPYQVPGNPVVTQTAIPPGSYCMRTVSDPINLGNSSGAAGQGIQGFSEWTSVYPGALQIRPNSISSILTGNTISLGESFGDNIQITPAPGKSIRLNGQTVASTIIVQTQANITNVVAPTINCVNGFFSTLNVSTFTIGNVAYNSFTASTVNVSTANVTGDINYNRLLPINPGTSLIQTAQLNATSGVATNQLTCQGTGVFTSTLQAPALLGISSINGAPYGGAIPSTFTTLTTTSNTGLVLGGGQLAIGNGAISVATFAYGDVNSRGLNSISTSWMAPNPPVPVPTGGTSTFPSGTFVLSGLRIMWGYYYIGSSVPTIDYVPNFGAIPCITLTCDTSIPLNGIVAMVSNNTATGCSIRIVNATLGIGSGVGVYWMAIGKA